MKYSSAYQV